MGITTYTSGVEVKATIPLIVDGVQVIAESVQYRIIDGKDIELVARTPIFVEPNVAEVLVTVSELLNTISTNDVETRDIRIIELYINDGTGEFKIEYIYGIEKENVLVEGVNSFQGYGRSLMTALSISKLDWWDGASRSERVGAMIEAKRSFSALTLRCGTINVEDISTISQSQYSNLPEDLKSALCRAQILQANFLLTDDENEDLRDSGVLSKTVGEAKIMFKNGVKYKSAIDGRAIQELSRWVVSGKRIGRT